MCMVDGSTRGLFISIGIVGSLYVIVSAGMCLLHVYLKRGLCVVCDFVTICCQGW